MGIISVASNEIPREMAEMTRAALNNDWVTARRIQRKYLALMQANFIETSPMPVKAVLAMMGKIDEVYRLPLLPMRRETRSKLQKIAAEAGVIARLGSPAPDVVNFYIYENWLSGPHKIVLHRSSLADSATTVRDAPPDTTPTMHAGTVLTPRLRKRARPRQGIAGVLIRSECKCI